MEEQKEEQKNSPSTLIRPINWNMTTFEPEVEYILTELLSLKSKTNAIRQMLVFNRLLDYESFRQYELKL